MISAGRANAEGCNAECNEPDDLTNASRGRKEGKEESRRIFFSFCNLRLFNLAEAFHLNAGHQESSCRLPSS